MYRGLYARDDVCACLLALVSHLAAPLAHFLALSTQATGEFQSTGGITAKPNDMAACQVTPGSEWILAKVLHHDVGSGMYKLADEDIESNKSAYLFTIIRFGSRWFGSQGYCRFLQTFLFCYTVFHLPEQQVQILHPVEKLRAGDVVYAVYPDTTSFYQVSLDYDCRLSCCV